MSMLLTGLAFNHLTHTPVVVGLNPNHSNSWDTIRACPKVILAIEMDVEILTFTLDNYFKG